MKPVSLRTLVGAIGLAIALVTAGLMPAGYLFVGYSNDAETLELNARLAAGRLAKYIYVHPTLWQYQTGRLDELIADIETPGAVIHKRVRDANGRVILDSGPELVTPIFARSAPIVVAGTTVGRVEIETSLRDLLSETLLVCQLSAVLGFAVYFAVRILPLRVLDRTFAAFEKAQQATREEHRDFAAALENMPHALAMFDADERLVVGNARFAEMLGVPALPAAGRPTLGDVVEAAVKSGLLAPIDAQFLLAKERRLLAEGRAETFVWRLADGRSISVQHQPMSTGGWVAAYLDPAPPRVAEGKISVALAG
jgi:PAS domain-containing protein